MPVPSDEKRKFTRIDFRTEIKVSAGEADIISSNMRNVSLGGIFIDTKETIPVGAECVITIDLVGPASSLRFLVEGEVVRQDEGGIAVRFTRMDADSLIHLRHLIKIHADDPSTIDQEYYRKLLEIEEEMRSG